MKNDIAEVLHQKKKKIRKYEEKKSIHFVMHFRNGRDYEKHYFLDSLHEIQCDYGSFECVSPPKLSLKLYKNFMHLHICDRNR